MTISVNGRPDVLSQQEIWDFCRVHRQLGLSTDALGQLAFGEPADPTELTAEVKACVAHEPKLTNAGERVLGALQNPTS